MSDIENVIRKKMGKYSDQAIEITHKFMPDLAVSVANTLFLAANQGEGTLLKTLEALKSYTGVNFTGKLITDIEEVTDFLIAIHGRTFTLGISPEL